jgi:hypothetical protein
VVSFLENYNDFSFFLPSGQVPSLSNWECRIEVFQSHHKRSTWLPAFEITEIARNCLPEIESLKESFLETRRGIFLFILSYFVLKGGGGRESAQVSFCL